MPELSELHRGIARQKRVGGKNRNAFSGCLASHFCAADSTGEGWVK